jgi:hypothetical protein
MKERKGRMKGNKKEGKKEIIEIFIYFFHYN